MDRYRRIEEGRKENEREAGVREDGEGREGGWRGKGTNFRAEEEVGEVCHGGRRRRRVIQMRPKTVGELDGEVEEE